jgi:Spherulation-specific family 4
VTSRGNRGDLVAADPGDPRRPRRTPRLLPVLVLVLLIAAGVVLAVKLTSRSAQHCQSSFVPAFFPPQEWNQAVRGGHGPAVLILNPASGPGTAPDPAFQAAVRQLTGAGTDVIGYIGTDYSQQPLSQAEQYVRDYRDWYGVTGIFLDQTPTSGSQQIGYYRTLASYIRRASPGAVIWLNPGVYPDQSYMSVGSVVMVFEGPYATYVGLKVPGWAQRYSAARFAHTIYATPAQDAESAVGLSRSRNAGYVYVTDGAGPNPYGGLPSYWPREQAAVAGDCAAA